MKVVLRGVPPSLNKTAGRKNVWDYRKAKQEWTMAVKLSCLACKDRPGKPYGKALVTITYFFPDMRRHDADNYAAAQACQVRCDGRAVSLLLSPKQAEMAEIYQSLIQD